MGLVLLASVCEHAGANCQCDELCLTYTGEDAYATWDAFDESNGYHNEAGSHSCGACWKYANSCEMALWFYPARLCPGGACACNYFGCDCQACGNCELPFFRKLLDSDCGDYAYYVGLDIDGRRQHLGEKYCAADGEWTSAEATLALEDHHDVDDDGLECAEFVTIPPLDETRHLIDALRASCSCACAEPANGRRLRFGHADTCACATSSTTSELGGLFDTAQRPSKDQLIGTSDTWDWSVPYAFPFCPSTGDYHAD